MSVCTEVEAASTTETPCQELAFERYVLPEVDVITRVAVSLTRDPIEAEDLVQDTLLRAYRGICGFDGRFPRAWLLTILRNTHASRNRRRRPELLHDPDSALEALSAAADPDEAPEGQVVDRVFDSVVADALDSLPDRFRQVVQLVDVEDLSYQEAADALGVPIGTVMSRLHRARGRLRKRLEAAGVAPRGSARPKPEREVVS